MKAFKILVSFIIILMVSTLSVKAHTYWIQTEGSHKINELVQVKIYFGEYVTGEIMKGKALDKVKDIKLLVRFEGLEDMLLTMIQDSACWKGSFTPAQAGSYEIIGINDTREVQDWHKHGFGIVRPVQYLKTIYQVGAVATPQSNKAFLDIVTQKKEDFYTLLVYKNRQPAAKTKFFISQPDGEEVPVETNEKGMVEYKPTSKGLYIIGIEWVDKTPGIFSGKEYTSIRYRLDASFNY
ncbi:MAG: hypothetical protein EOP53_16575 [Sphingobacteriales bacterium]|nr:MAG: hypothetical protein EOP53_16575 [Sphingobacteriales bacterium]